MKPAVSTSTKTAKSPSLCQRMKFGPLTTLHISGQTYAIISKAAGPTDQVRSRTTGFGPNRVTP